MPFVTAEHRLKPDNSIPGDRCYVWYKWIMDKWKANPCWTTVDEIYTEIFKIHCLAGQKNESIIALELAWQVFFNLHVMEYERKKREENGDIS